MTSASATHALLEQLSSLVDANHVLVNKTEIAAYLEKSPGIL